MQSTPKKLTVLFFASFFFSCSGGNNSTSASKDLIQLQQKLDEVALKASDLEKIIDGLMSTGQTDFSDCSVETIPDDLARKICALAQSASEQVRLSLQASLDSITTQFSSQISAARQDIAAQQALLDSQTASLAALELSIDSISNSMAVLQSQFNDLSAHLTSVETALTALYAIVNTLVPVAYNACVVNINSPAAGTLDTSFGTNGFLSWDRSGANNQIRSMVPLAFGKFLVSESVGNSPNAEVYVSRHQSDGTLDADFGINGISIGNFPNLNGDLFMGTPLAVAEDGKIYMNGAVANSSQFDHGIIRLLPNGSYDTSFANGGRLDFQYGTNQSLAPGLHL